MSESADNPGIRRKHIDEVLLAIRPDLQKKLVKDGILDLFVAFNCVLFMKESTWNGNAINEKSTARGWGGWKPKFWPPRGVWSAKANPHVDPIAGHKFGLESPMSTSNMSDVLEANYAHHRDFLIKRAEKSALALAFLNHVRPKLANLIRKGKSKEALDDTAVAHKGGTTGASDELAAVRHHTRAALGVLVQIREA